MDFVCVVFVCRLRHGAGGRGVHSQLWPADAAGAGGICMATMVFFQIGTTAGWCGLAAAMVIIPVIWIITYKIFPKTAIGRALELRTARRSLGDAIPDQERLQSFAGKSGTVVSPLRPVGVCRIDGQRVVCSAQVGFIEKNTDIEVVNVEGQLITVRVKQ